MKNVFLTIAAVILLFGCGLPDQSRGPGDRQAQVEDWALKNFGIGAESGSAVSPKGVLDTLVPVEYRWADPPPGYSFAAWPIFESWMEVRFENQGDSDVVNGSATITSAPANVTVVDGDVSLGDIPVGGSAWSADSFRLQVDMSNPQDPNEGIDWQASMPGGSLVGWGYNFAGQTDVPAGNDFVAVAAGLYHSLALRADGSLVSWGSNAYGLVDNVPAGNDFVAIAAGVAHSLALKDDGSLVGWGWNNNGQATVPAGNDYIAIAAGWSHNLALRADGSLVHWGYSGYMLAAWVPSGNDFVAVAAGRNFSLALKEDGTLVGWGVSTYGQTSVPSGNFFVAVAAGESNAFALSSLGSLTGWGSNSSGQTLGVPGGYGIVAFAAGSEHGLALKEDGTLVGWGNNYYGQTTVPDGNDFIAISAGEYHSLAIRE